MLSTIHPKVRASGQVGIPVALFVSILAGFGVHVPVEVAAPILTLLMLAAGYVAPRLPGEVGS